MFSLLSLGGSAFWDNWTTPFSPGLRWKVTKKSATSGQPGQVCVGSISSSFSPVLLLK